MKCKRPTFPVPERGNFEAKVESSIGRGKGGEDLNEFCTTQHLCNSSLNETLTFLVLLKLNLCWTLV